ncbi:uncharacterized protein METZ01_LOCUS345883 [marine metagenome]|uniref:Uncharacterized protein n=1 Tax=marine metagenome TaxID=408172 RepID=A0A382R5L3_9ZZZZ
MLFPTTRIELFFRGDQDCLLALEPDGTFHEFDVKMFREAKELFTRYDEAHFHEEDNLDEMHNFCERMARESPEVIDVESPYLN